MTDERRDQATGRSDQLSSDAGRAAPVPVRLRLAGAVTAALGFFLATAAAACAGAPPALAADHLQTTGQEHAGPDLIRDIETLVAARRYAEAQVRVRPWLTRFSGSRAAMSESDFHLVTLAADILGLEGDIEGAISLRLQFLDRRVAQLGGASAPVLDELTSLAREFIELDRFAEAEPVLQQALGDSEAVRSHPRTIDLLRMLADVRARNGDLVGAEELLLAALALQREASSHVVDQAITQARLALTYEALGRGDDASTLAAEVMSTLRQRLGPDHPTTLTWRVRLARLVAAQNFQQTVQDLTGLWTRYNAAYSRDHPATIRAGGLLVEHLLRDLIARERPLEVSREMIAGVRENRRRRSAGIPDGSASDLDDRAYFELHADALWTATTEPGAGETPRPERLAQLLPEAFAALQEAGEPRLGRSIVMMAARRRADGSGGETERLARERETLSRRRSNASDQLTLSFTNGVELRDTLTAEIRDIDTRIDEIDRRLRSIAPAYEALVRPTPLMISQVQDALMPTDILVFLSPGARGTHVFTITKESADWERTYFSRREVARLVGSLRQSLTDPARPFDSDSSIRLYDSLLHHQLLALPGPRRLFVIAQGPLATIPFSVLIANSRDYIFGSASSRPPFQWLADRYQLIHLPSVNAFVQLRQFERHASGFIGIGDPALRDESGNATGPTAASARAIRLTGVSSRGTVLADVQSIRSLPSLKNAGAEISGAAALFGGEAVVRTREAASEAAVRDLDRSNALSRAAIILFSTHAATINESGDIQEAGIILTPPPGEATPENDGYLSASDVAGFSIGADLVILSACSTAADEEGAPGFVTLPRAFFYSGARALIASHWSVDDVATSSLMIRTLDLAAGVTGSDRLSYPAALQQAMREIRTASHGRWAHPYYWAPFVFMGIPSQGR